MVRIHNIFILEPLQLCQTLVVMASRMLISCLLSSERKKKKKNRLMA